MAAGNPLWEVHEGLWTMLEAWTPWAALVAERKRIKYIQTVKDAIQYRENITPDVLPEFAIVNYQTKFHDRIAGNDSQLTLVWHCLITTGDERFDSFLDVQWQTFRALLSWETYLKDALTWNDAGYVTNGELYHSSDSVFDQTIEGHDLHRGVTGWASVWTCDTECEFKHSALVDVSIT
jgi:hypothetical protein